MDDHPNFRHFLRIGLFLIGVVKDRIKVTEAGYTPYWLEGVIKVESNTSEYTDVVYAMTVNSIKEFE